MARSKSICRGRRTTGLNAGSDLPPMHNTGPRHFQVGICLAAILLAWPACHARAFGPAIGFKVGAQTLENPIDLNRTTRARFDLEISTALLHDDRLDLALSFGGLSLGSLSERYADVIDGVLIEETYRDAFRLYDIRLASRFYPFGSTYTVRPHIGGGIGYFQFVDDWRYEYAETVRDPHHPHIFRTFIDEYRGTDTLAKGFFSFATAGLTIPVGSWGELLFEFQYDFAKRDAGFDFGGPIYMIGARVRF